MKVCCMHAMLVTGTRDRATMAMTGILVVPNLDVCVCAHIAIDDTHVALVGIFECVKYANIVLARQPIQPFMLNTIIRCQKNALSLTRRSGTHIDRHTLADARSLVTTSHYSEHLF